MYAVIQTGGKQYRVANGDVITVEKLGGDAGSTLAIEPVLMVNDGKATQIGAPVIEGASVTAEVVEQTRGDKIVVFKKKRRQGYRRTMGHRQELTVLRVLDVTGKPATKKKAAVKKKKPAAAPQIRPEGVMGQFAARVLEKRGLKTPVGRIVAK